MFVFRSPSVSSVYGDLKGIVVTLDTATYCPALNMEPFWGYLGLATVIKNIVWFRLASKRQEQQRKTRVVGKVKDIYFYPIKSAKELSLQEVTCTKSGFKIGKLGDRSIVLVTPEGCVVKGLRHPMIKTLQWTLRGHVLHMQGSCREGEPLTIALDKLEAARQKTTIKYFVDAEVYDCGKKAAEWISDFVGKPGYSLGYCGPGLKKRDSAEIINTILTEAPFATEMFSQSEQSTKLNFSDLSALHLISQKTVDDVSDRLGRNTSALRFRPNIVVEGVETPYEEDTWRDICIGDVQLYFDSLTMRCATVDVDPWTGAMDNSSSSTLNAISRWRGLYKILQTTKTCLGILCSVTEPGVIRVGDTIVATVG